MKRFLKRLIGADSPSRGERRRQAMERALHGRQQGFPSKAAAAQGRATTDRTEAMSPEEMRDRALREFLERQEQRRRQREEEERAAQAARAATGESAREVLSEVKGVGPAKQDALLERFPSIEALKAASVSELAEVKGVGVAIAAEIKRTLR
ncbi:MAG: helix-hairpin-helix domain-containing protein [Actinomycetota bacterium]|nr:helix-hairpin-helix domain-containing protein [Actinomycetota bacterium]